MPGCRWKRRSLPMAFAALLACASAAAQAETATTLAVQITMPAIRKAARHAVPAAVWLSPVGIHAAAPSRGPYTLLQKDRMFSPHMLIVPVGSVVHFPNEDPFYHNVFSLFDGRRFDLGLYEAGKTRDVTFSREGLSYIFCNIHPEMSAVVLALSTPFYGSGEAPGDIAIHNLPAGEYDVHLWVEGESQFNLGPAVKRIVIGGQAGRQILKLTVSAPAEKPQPHTNEYGRPYGQPEKPVY